MAFSALPEKIGRQLTSSDIDASEASISVSVCPAAKPG
jgi:hypothetical protein